MVLPNRPDSPLRPLVIRHGVTPYEPREWAPAATYRAKLIPETNTLS